MPAACRALPCTLQPGEQETAATQPAGTESKPASALKATSMMTHKTASAACCDYTNDIR